jgi:hypothetical protein
LGRRPGAGPCGVYPSFIRILEEAKPRLAEIDSGWLSAIEAAQRPAFLAALRRLAPATTNRFGGW